MAEYYLISQLPSLDNLSDGTPLPISEERFFELCERFLGKKARDGIKKISLTPTKEFEPSGFAFLDKWNESERNLRYAVGKVRAEKLKKPFDTANLILPIEHIKAASTALDAQNPLKAEEFLNEYRLQLLESLKPMDNFSDDYIFYYGIKLKLISRIRLFNTERGKTAYKNIYNSIIMENNSEEKQ